MNFYVSRPGQREKCLHFKKVLYHSLVEVCTLQVLFSCFFFFFGKDPDLILDKIVLVYLEKTPGGGVHYMSAL